MRFTFPLYLVLTLALFGRSAAFRGGVLPSIKVLSIQRPLRAKRLSSTPVTYDATDPLRSMRLYNTMTRSKELFVPRASPKVSFYSCGPTVYDFAHIGNFRAFLTYDVLKRWLAFLGFEVEHVCNLTDIDDKIIARMQRDGLSLEELTEKYATCFFEDLAALNIVPADHYPRATEHVNDIMSMVSALIDKGAAYEVNNSVYFDVSKAARYGRLARLDTQGLVDGSSEGGGLTASEQFLGEKKGPRDFALWKAYKPEADAGVAWRAPWGEEKEKEGGTQAVNDGGTSSSGRGSVGRPGWHIECSAMAKHFFGDHIDLHAGGVDLVFPHHDNEIAQSEAFTGYGLSPTPTPTPTPTAATSEGEAASSSVASGSGSGSGSSEEFCRYWVHNGFVNVDNEKMSKSKGNFVTLRGRFSSAAEVRAFRYLVVMSQYRSPLNFNAEALQGAKNALKKLDRFRGLVLNALPTSSPPEAEAVLTEAVPSEAVQSACASSVQGLRLAMGDDLNTPRAGACLFGLVKQVQPFLNAGTLSSADAVEVSACLDAFNAALGVFYELPEGFLAAPEKEEGQAKEGGGDGEGGAVPERGVGGGLGGAGEGLVPASVLKLVSQRTAAKDAKDWAKADLLRVEIKEAGFEVKDVKGGAPLVTLIEL